MNELLTETELSVRKDFSKIPSILEIPDLIEIQKQTFERFLQTDVEPEKRENTGLQAVFSSVFPIKDFNDSASLEFVGYTLEEREEWSGDIQAIARSNDGGWIGVADPRRGGGAVGVEAVVARERSTATR